MPTSKKQRASAHDQNAFLEAYDYKCEYCSRPIDHSCLEIDHIVPESLLDDPDKFARVREKYGLRPDFDLGADYNKVPACHQCNSDKRADILHVSLEIKLTTAAKKAEKVSELRQRSRNRKLTARWVSQGHSLLANDPSTGPKLRQMLEESGSPIENDVDSVQAQTAPKSAWQHEEIIRIFGVASLGLLKWPKETAGQWLERPEMQVLHDIIHLKPRSCTALLGEPGCGKSALLAKLASELQDEGAAFLALKADMLPRDVNNLQALTSALGLPCEIDVGVRQLAQDCPVVLLIDQVDALSELMDQHSARLDLICRLVNRLRDIDNVHIILSCRSFEFHHDLRLSGLRPEDAVTLGKPSWASIEAILTYAGISSEAWPDDAKEVLRVPQHLAMFVAHFAADGQTRHFKSYHAMIEAVLTKRLFSKPWGRAASDALDHIATELAKAEELWLPTSRFIPTFLTELDRLVAAGILVYTEDRFRLGFQHQTVFDYCRARAFTSGVADLVGYVLHGQDALFLRPTLWSALRFMRESDPPGYRRQFGALWAEKLRPHVRFLLVEFLGQVDEPTMDEALFLDAIMAEPVLRVKALSAMDGRPAWLKKLVPHLSALMVGEDVAAGHAAGYLRSAAKTAPDTVIGLLETHWHRLPEKNYLTIWVLSGLLSWDERSVQLAEKVLRRPVERKHWQPDLAEEAAKTAPELAPRLVTAELWGSLEFAEATSVKVPPPPGADALEEEQYTHQLSSLEVEYDAVKKIVADNIRWHDLPKVAEASPESFIRNVWPWVAHVAAKYSKVKVGRSLAYDIDYVFELDATSRRPNAFICAVKIGLQLMAQRAPQTFLAHAEVSKSSSHMTIHRLLAHGFTHVGPDYSGQAIGYLLEDTRRFALGGQTNCDETRAVIAAAATNADVETRLKLEKAIIGWSKYYSRSEDDADLRRDVLKWNREERLVLLSAFPGESLSPGGRSIAAQEKRAFPHLRDRNVESGEAQWIGSPMTAEEMAKASDGAILGFLDELNDRTGTDHPNPRRHMEGGGVQAAQAFGAFAKENPERALGLLSKLDPTKHQRPAGHAIRSIAETPAFDPEKLLAIIHSSDALGFQSEEFRHEVAYGLEKVSTKAKGLPAETCELLESWLLDESDVDEVDSENGSQPYEPRSMILNRGGGLLPHRNYPILHALFLSYMQRDPEEPDSWLGVVERHLKRSERPRVWKALAGHHLKFLRKADRTRALAVIDQLLDEIPGLLESKSGVRLLADIHWWLPQEAIDRYSDRWLGSNWRASPQAAAEFAMLRHCLVPSDSRASTLVEVILKRPRGNGVASQMRLGIAYIAGNLWNHPPAREAATRALLGLLPIEDQAEAQAWLSICQVQEPPPADIHTQQILDALATQNAILRCSHTSYLIDQLKGLLQQGREHQRVCMVVTRLMTEIGKEVGDIRTSWAASAGDLVDIALTLQRFTDTRECGLKIFEMLMAEDAYKLSDALWLLDRRFPT